MWATGGRVDSGAGEIGYFDHTTGMATVDGANSAWNDFGDLEIGVFGSGTLNITNGALVQNVNGTLGAENGVGNVSIDGSNSRWIQTGELIVGNGHGTLSITGGGYVENASGVIGSLANSMGTVTISGPTSKWKNSGALFVGDRGNGSLSISGGARVESVTGEIGYFDKPVVGTASVDGANSAWIATGNFEVGVFGFGTLNITNGGLVQNGDGTIGAENGDGNVTVNGSNSRWIQTGSLIVGNGQGTLNITAGGYVENTSAVIGKIENSNGSVTVAGPMSKWKNSGGIFVGDRGDGTLSISGGGSVESTSAEVGYFDSSVVGTVTVDGANSTWIATGDFEIGIFGTGNLNITSGGLVQSRHDNRRGKRPGKRHCRRDEFEMDSVRALTVGNGRGNLTIKAGGYVENASAKIGILASSMGTVSVSGSGSQWNDTGNMVVGSGGTGQLQVSAAGLVTSGSSTIGDSAGSHGTVTISGTGAHWIDSGLFLNVGNSGNGTLNILAGGLVENSTARIGAASTGNGVANVDGPNSRWSISQFIDVGSTGIGTLQISAGGLVTSPDGVIGDSANSQGAASVSGANSRWINSSILAVGQSGAGAIDIGGGALVQSSAVFIAVNSGSSGIILVDSNSQLIAGSTLAVGVSGSANLSIMAGGRVSSPSAFLGLQPGSTGKATIAGAGSKWTNTGQLILGGNGSAPGNSGGSATLRVQAGGELVTGDTYIFGGDLLSLEGGTLSASEISFPGAGDFAWTAGTLHLGSYHRSLTVPNDGTLAPGNSVGQTDIDGNYFQLSHGMLEIEIGGPTSADRVNITGVANFSGNLQLKLLNGFIPNPATSFTVFDSRGIMGSFLNVANGQRLTTVGNGGSFLIHYGPGSPFDPDQIILSDFEQIFPLGDFNLDHQVTAADIPSMLSALTDLNAYTSTNSLNPTQLAAIGDFDSSGTVTNRDIQGLLDLVASSGGGSVAAVPEPESLLLFSFGALVLAMRKRR